MTRLDAAAIVAAYDFGGFRRVVDVGGGQGALTAAILERLSVSSISARR